MIVTLTVAWANAASPRSPYYDHTSWAFQAQSWLAHGLL